MFPIFLSNKKCRLEHVVNELMSCFITEFLWIFSYKLQGILLNSMDTLWHSLKLYRYFRKPHGIPWNSTIFPGIPWTIKETPWNFMAFHGTPSPLHGSPWILHGIPWNSMDTPWKFRGIPWISTDFHGIPWRYFTRASRVETALLNEYPHLWIHCSSLSRKNNNPLLRIQLISSVL